jgi:hypothetical protein
VERAASGERVAPAAVLAAAVAVPSVGSTRYAASRQTTANTRQARGRTIRRVTARRLEAVVRQCRRVLLAAICIPVVFAFAACGDDTSAPGTVAPTTGTSPVAASTSDAVGLTADLYEEVMRDADAMTASFTDSATAQATCAGVAQGAGIADCRRQIKAAIATAEHAASMFKISSFRSTHDLAAETCQSALDDRQFAVHEYLQALREWADDAALNNPAGSPNGEGTNTVNAVTRIRDSQLPAAKDEVASACRPAPG